MMVTTLCITNAVLAVVLVCVFILYLGSRERLDDIRTLVRNYHPIDEGASAYLCVDFLGRQFLDREADRNHFQDVVSEYRVRAEKAEKALAVSSSAIDKHMARIDDLERALASVIEGASCYLDKREMSDDEGARCGWDAAEIVGREKKAAARYFSSG